MARTRKGPIVPWPYTSGQTYRAYKEGYARAIETAADNDVLAVQRFELYQTSGTIRRLTAFNAGWAHGRSDLKMGLVQQTLPLPNAQGRVDLPPPV